MMRRLVDEKCPNLGTFIAPHTSWSNLRWALGLGYALGLDLPWAADNGCFTGLDSVAFLRMCCRVRGVPQCLFVTCPDVVGDARATIELYEQWEGRVLYHTGGQPVAFVLQDGQEDLLLPSADAYFLGGTTAFKLSRTASDIVVDLKRRGCYVHMGRVTTLKRIKYAYTMGVDSVDGTNMNRFANKYVRKFCEYVVTLDASKRLGGAE